MDEGAQREDARGAVGPPVPGGAAGRRRVFVRAGGSFLAIGVVGWAALSVLEGTEDASARLAAVHPGWILASALAWTSSLAAQGARWRVLLPIGGAPGASSRRDPGAARPGTPATPEPAAATPPTALELARLAIGANVVGAALPGPAGELSASLVLAERGIPFVGAFAAAVLGRVVALGVIGAATLGLGAALYDQLPTDARAVVAAPTLVLAGGGLSAPLVVRFARPLGALAERAAGAVLPGAAHRVRAAVARVREALDALADLPLRAWAVAVGWSVVSLCIQSVALRWAFGAAGAWPAWRETAFVHLLMSLAAIVGIVVPAGGLAVDGLFLLVFPAVTGVDAPTTVLAAVAVRWMRVLVLLAGVPALGGMFERLLMAGTEALRREDGAASAG
jgi:hypothetical protein